MAEMTAEWPELPRDWAYATLHMWMQMAGKIALAQAPPLNHCWSISLRITPRGLITRTLPHGEREFTLEFDFVAHELVINVSDGTRRALKLAPRSVADFYRELMSTLAAMKLPVRIWSMPVEVPNPIRFEQDEIHRSYDRDAVNRFWRLVALVAPVLASARCRFIGKCSPVHFFWGAFDLAVTRFSGRRAPDRDGPAFMREAYSHEVISHGFWPGSGPILEPAFYAYAVPEPAGLKQQRVRPEGAYYHAEMGEFILPYEAARSAPAPSDAITEFVDSTYAAAATLAGWDRAALDR